MQRRLSLHSLMVCAAAFAGLARAQTPEEFFPGRLMFSPEEEALYMRRYEKAQVRRTADEIYVDQEAMAGVDDWDAAIGRGAGRANDFGAGPG